MTKIVVISGRTIIAAGLRNMEQEYREARESVEESRKARREAVVDALDAGWTHAEIADAMGLSRGRIGQIANSKGEASP